ncbi:hypothetical protein L596_023026 [Steinernema carpocapsae]|uniref:Uncharacterized protein n=1 Tax=Steinernema carpocapsae TaxID=34508 RepID=A0A4U5MCD1_STECR|nr:hypothetical protein L596_023026 [Steinernema carpocapsae]
MVEVIEHRDDQSTPPLASKTSAVFGLLLFYCFCFCAMRLSVEKGFLGKIYKRLSHFWKPKVLPMPVGRLSKKEADLDEILLVVCRTAEEFFCFSSVPLSRSCGQS